MQKARRHTEVLRPLVGTRFQVLFHSPSGVLFHLSLTVLVRYRSPGSTQPWRVVPPGSDRVSRQRSYSGTSPGGRALSPTGLLPTVVQVFHKLRLTHDFVTPARACRPWERRPTTPDGQRLHACTHPVWADPLSLATTRGVSVDFLSSGYLDVSVRPLASSRPMDSAGSSAAFPTLGF